MTKRILITGANSGLGFEAARQLAEQNNVQIILSARSQAKADAAKEALHAETGRDVFDTTVADVASIASAHALADTLIAKGNRIDQLLLNAGVVPGDAVTMTDDDLEMTYAASIVGHHILATRLVDAGIVPDGGRIVLVSSEGARNDFPKSFGISLADFATKDSSAYGSTLMEAMDNFAHGKLPGDFDGLQHYATVKLFSTWWVAEFADRMGDKIDVVAVSPGASLGTNLAREMTGFRAFFFKNIMSVVGKWIGYNQTVPVAAKRYVDILDRATVTSGRAYFSAPKKMVGPLIEAVQPHLYDEMRRKIAWDMLERMTQRSNVTARKTA